MKLLLVLFSLVCCLAQLDARKPPHLRTRRPCTGNDESVLDVAAFNIQIFGTKKMKNMDIANILVKILLRYDLTLVQEIRDSTGRAIKQLMKRLNEAAKAKGSPQYKIVVSPRLGRSSSKEEYAFIYRSDWLTLRDTHLYNDTREVFQREPFAARFQSLKTPVKDFAVAAIHTSPEDAQFEIGNLSLVHREIEEHWNITEIMIMGDFNGGCTYVDDWGSIPIASDSNYTWLIDNSVDTMSSVSSDCPYDRIVITGQNLLKSIVPASIGALRYDDQYHLNASLTKEISDHYPVHFQILTDEELEYSNSCKTFEMHDHERAITKRMIYKMKDMAREKPYYTVNILYRQSGGMEEIRAGRESHYIEDARQHMKLLIRDFPNLLTDRQYRVALRRLKEIVNTACLPSGHGLYRTLRDYYASKAQQFSVELRCAVRDRGCWVYVSAC